jgi:hypothetical protein
MDPVVFEEHSYEENELENTGVYTACAVTLAMKKLLEEEDTLLEDCTMFLKDYWVHYSLVTGLIDTK